MKELYYLLLPVLLLAACNKQIDQIRPLTKIDKEGQLASLDGIIETTVGNYMLLGSSTGNTQDEKVLDLSESRGNNVTLQKWGPPSKLTDAFFFRNDPGPTQGNSAAFYRGSFQVIVSVNATLEGIAALEASAFSSLGEDDRNKCLYAKGENIFIRALTYFNLARIYGKPYYQQAGSSPCVPIKTSSRLDDSPSPATVKEVYMFIASELQKAAWLMKAPVKKTNSFASTTAAWALLSRVYLYMGGAIAAPDPAFNRLAVLYADSAIHHSGGQYALLQGNDYKNMFGDDELGQLGRVKSAGNREIIFMLDNSVRGSSIGSMYHFDQQYNVGATFLPSASLRQLFAPADLRGTFFKKNANSGFVETTKWLVLNQAWVTRAPNILLRVGELYLNRAEAYAKLQNMAMARSDLKEIHTRAGLPAADIDQLPDAALMAAILKERRMELAFEGHNSFDYFRNGLPMTRTAADNNGTAMTVQPDDAKVVFTLPND